MPTAEDRIDRVEVAIGRLAEAQIRAEERLGRLEGAVERLAAAQARTEERMGELVAAQARTEERMGRLEAAVERLAEAQARTETRVGQLEGAVDRLIDAIDRLRKHVGGLSDTVGGDIEDIAYIVLHDVLKREFGWDVGVLERTWKTWDGEIEEVDVFGMATDPARPENTIWIVGEAKHNLTMRDVERFTQMVDRARQNLTGEIFPVCFCYRARPEVVAQVDQAGLRLVFSYGKLV